MSPFVSSGTLTTDKREVAISETWDTDVDWNSYQSKNGVIVSSGVLKLEQVSIPSSAIHRWKYDEGSGTTVADSIGTQTGTRNGWAWISDTYQGSNAGDSDGTDDYTSVGTWGTFGSSLYSSSFAIGFTIETTDDAKTVLGQLEPSGAGTGSNQVFAVHIGDPTGNGAIAGTPSLQLRDGDGNTYITSGSTAINDGSRYRVLINKTGASGSSSIEYHVNDSQQTTNVGIDQTIQDLFSDFTVDVAHFARNNNGTEDQFIDAVLDDIIIYGSSLSASEITDDYNAQPWT